MSFLMKNVIVVLLFGLSMTACTSKLTITPTSPIIVYPGDFEGKKMDDMNWRSSDKIGEVLIDDLPRLKTDTGLKNYRPNQAFAIGYPYECGASYHSWNWPSEREAVTFALEKCLQWVKGRGKHVGEGVT